MHATTRCVGCRDAKPAAFDIVPARAYQNPNAKIDTCYVVGEALADLPGLSFQVRRATHLQCITVPRRSCSSSST